jgi:hypothetical protein
MTKDEKLITINNKILNVKVRSFITRILFLDPVLYSIIADLLENSPETTSAVIMTGIMRKYGKIKIPLTKSYKKKKSNDS